jgi:hypothetical protein
MLVAVTTEQHSMSNVVPICAAVAAAPHAPTRRRMIPARLTGSSRRWWRRARLSIEVIGWLCTAASIYALVIA